MRTTSPQQPGAARPLISLLLLFLALSAPQARAGDKYPPSKMTFQGFLTDAGTPPVPLGNTAPANVTVLFKIYKSAVGAGSDLLWGEQQVVTVDKGHFSVLLGQGSAISGTSLPHAADLSTLFIGSDVSERYIGITVGTGNEITPRIQFFPAPYAHLSRAAHAVVDGQGVAVLTATNMNLLGPITVSSITGDGAGITNLNASVLASGTLPDARLSTNVARKDASGTLTANAFVGNGTIPIGGIIMWSGETNSIPAGWVLCNGQNGTPNLQDRFIVGRGASHGINATGGSNTTTLDSANLPPHTHTYKDRYFIETFTFFDFASLNYEMTSTGFGANGHDVNNNAFVFTLGTTELSNTAAAPFSNEPAYFALAFIMRKQ